MFKSIVLLLPILLPLIGGLVVFRMRDAKARRIAVSACVLCTLVSAGRRQLFAGSFPAYLGLGRQYCHLSAAGRHGSFSMCLVSGIWTLVAFFAYEYMQHEGREEPLFWLFTP